MMPSEPLEVVRAYNEAYHARDLEGTLALVDETCEFVTQHRGVMRGHDAVRAFMERQTYGVAMVPTDQRYFARPERGGVRHDRVALRRVEIHDGLASALAAGGMTQADERS
jgi:hypothetical protein